MASFRIGGQLAGHVLIDVLATMHGRGYWAKMRCWPSVCHVKCCSGPLVKYDEADNCAVVAEAQANSTRAMKNETAKAANSSTISTYWRSLRLPRMEATSAVRGLGSGRIRSIRRRRPTWTSRQSSR